MKVLQIVKLQYMYVHLNINMQNSCAFSIFHIFFFLSNKVEKISKKPEIKIVFAIYAKISEKFANYTEVVLLSILQIHANCRIRRVYFSDRLYSEDELPAEFKLYLPVQNKVPAKVSGPFYLCM